MSAIDLALVLGRFEFLAWGYLRFICSYVRGFIAYSFNGLKVTLTKKPALWQTSKSLNYNVILVARGRFELPTPSL